MYICINIEREEGRQRNRAEKRRSDSRIPIQKKNKKTRSKEIRTRGITLAVHPPAKDIQEIPTLHR